MSKMNPSELLISRRKFLLGAGTVAAGTAAFALGCQPSSDGQSSTKGDAGGTPAVSASDDAVIPTNVSTISTQLGDVAVLSVAEDCVFSTDDCQYMKKKAGALKRTLRAHLPYGTIIWADDDDVAACLLPCETSKPLSQIGLLNLNNADLYCLLKNAVGEAEGFEIYDVRANSNGAIWLEANILNGTWKVYAARMQALGVLGKAHLVAEGSTEWETPHLAVSGKYAFWQLSPAVQGSKQAASSSAGTSNDGETGDGSESSSSAADSSEMEIPENSLIMRVKFGKGANDAKVVYEAPGRMACPPTSTPKGIAIAPRADLESGSGAYYQLTHIEADSGIVDSALALPASMKPNYVAFGPTGFSFAFESIYSYGDGISNLGTYTATGTDASSGEGNSFGEWFRFPRSPFTAPAWTGNWFIVKSTGIVAGVDLQNRRYFSIDPEHVMQNYGEYLATSGASKRIVTYSNIDYTPIGDDRIYECNVRVWEPVKAGQLEE